MSTNSLSDKNKGCQSFVLEPLSVWKWLFTIILLLSFPLITLFDQMVGAMDESANRQINDLELELEKVAGRAVQEQKQAIQINEILKEYQKAILPVMYRIYINKTCLPKISFVPHVSGKQLNNWFVYKDRLRFSYYRKRLQKLIPGIEFIYWNRHYKMIGQNKNLLPKFVYSNLVKAICLRLKNRRGKDNKLRGYMKFLPLVSRYYSDNPGLVDFVKFGNIIRLVTTSDKIQYLFWKDFRGYLPDNDIFFKGYLVVINKEKLPAVFGLSRFKIRNREDWHNKNISLGWIDESKQSSSHLPYPFSVFRQNFWKKWISSQPDGVYRKDSLLMVVRRLDSRLIVVAAKSIKDI